MDERNGYWRAASLGGLLTSLLAAVYCCTFVLSPADLRAIYVDGFAAVYIPLTLLVFAVPGAIIGALVRWISARKR